MPDSSVLLITVDTLRADRLGCYGDRLARTPVIDSLAARGVLFEHALSCYPLTLPSHTSLLTGTVPPFHGVRNNGTYHAVEELVTLAERMAAAGRRTAAFVSAFVLDSQFGLDQGFEHYDDVPQRAMNLLGVYHERRADETTRAALEWFEGLAAGEPYFAWIHYFDPHAPYLPPGGVPEAMRERPYDAEVAWVDSQIGKLLEGLGEQGRMDDTLVVLTSDHGESLGEHGESTHGFFVYQGVLHVPLIFSHRRLPQGTRRSAWVSLVDVMPTVLDLVCGGDRETVFPARSLRGALMGEPLAAGPLYFECQGPLLNYGWAPLAGVALDGMKWIRAPRAELYELETDPGEEHDLARRRPERAGSMRRLLASVEERCRPPERASSARYELTAGDRARLRGLGYLDEVSTSGTVAAGSRLDPKDGIALIRMRDDAWGFYEQHDYPRALELIEKLLVRDPGNPSFHSHAGALLMQLGRPAEAVDHLLRAIAGGLRNPGTLYNLGMCEKALGESARAEKALRDALALDPKHLLALVGLGDLLAEQGQTVAALSVYERFIELWQGRPAVRAAVRKKIEDLRRQ